VISSVRIDGFRGVKEGQVDGLGPISILVGPNNSGKSTCLEAMAVVGFASALPLALRILLHRGGPPRDALAHIVMSQADNAKLAVRLHDDSRCECVLKIGGARNPQLLDRARAEGLEEPTLRVAVELVRHHPQNPRDLLMSAYVDGDGRISAPTLESGGPFSPFECRLVEVQAVRERGTLEDAYTSITGAGRIRSVVEALAKSMKGLTDLRILKAGDDFILHAVFEDGPPVPVYLTGDGSKRLVELAAAILGVAQDGVVLLEEPECYQHPRHLRELAALLVESAKAGRQIILSTHSIELVDLLLDVAAGEGLRYPFVHRLRLVDGRLSGVVLNREQATVSRNDLFEDLRA